MKKISRPQSVLALCFTCLSCFAFINIEAKCLNKNRSVSLKSSATIRVQKPLLLLFTTSANDDSLKIFQQCFNLPALQSFLEKKIDGSYQPLNVIIHSVPFANDGSVLHNGNTIVQLSKADIRNENTNAYFYFHEFKIEGTIAYVDFVYNYDQSTVTPKRLGVHLDIQKTGSDWTITNTKMEAN